MDILGIVEREAQHEVVGLGLAVELAKAALGKLLGAEVTAEELLQKILVLQAALHGEGIVLLHLDGQHLTEIVHYLQIKRGEATLATRREHIGHHGAVDADGLEQNLVGETGIAADIGTVGLHNVGHVVFLLHLLRQIQLQILPAVHHVEVVGRHDGGGGHGGHDTETGVAQRHGQMHHIVGDAHIVLQGVLRLQSRKQFTLGALQFLLQFIFGHRTTSSSLLIFAYHIVYPTKVGKSSKKNDGRR